VSFSIVVVAAAIVDASGVRGGSGIRSTWAELGLDPVQGVVRFQPIFGSPFRDFRRLDILSRMFLVATEACDVPAHLPDDLRSETALVSGSETGCLASDRRFERSLHTEAGIEPAVFPYTLPSTCLGEIAIRHRLHGPTICLSLAEGEEAQALRAAERLLHAGEAAAAIVLVGDWVPATEDAAAHKTRAVALLMRPADPDTPSLASISDLETDLFRAIDTLFPT
jgi:3-oxoacyl-(acyl-carrier-protein) synthase